MVITIGENEVCVPPHGLVSLFRILLDYWCVVRNRKGDRPKQVIARVYVCVWGFFRVEVSK